MNITAYGQNAKKAVDTSVQRINALEKSISRTDVNSDIYKMNVSSGEFVQISADTKELLSKAKFYGGLTNNALDVTVAPLTVLWNINGNNPKVPPQNEIDKALQLVLGNNFELKDNEARLPIKGQAIDLGALGKGYASALCYEIFKENKISAGIINLGGNICVVGKKNNRSDWSVAVKNPDNNADEPTVGYVLTSNKFVITSGDYERYFEVNGKRYHHIFDPKTGYPAEGGLRSVTIICDDGTEGDALSTALFVMGQDKAMQYYNSHKDFEAIFITKDKKIICTPGIKNSFTLTAKEYTIQ